MRHFSKFSWRSLYETLLGELNPIIVEVHSILIPWQTKPEFDGSSRKMSILNEPKSRVAHDINVQVYRNVLGFIPANTVVVLMEFRFMAYMSKVFMSVCSFNMDFYNFLPQISLLLSVLILSTSCSWWHLWIFIKYSTSSSLLIFFHLHWDRGWLLRISASRSAWSWDRPAFVLTPSALACASVLLSSAQKHSIHQT